MALPSRYLRNVFWLRRPPYTRWIAAALVVCCGLYLDLRPAPVVSYPFASAEVALGEPIELSLEWREIPTGVLPEWTRPVTGVAMAEIGPGTPLVPALAGEILVPADWWSVSIPVPYRVTPGSRIRIALEDTTVEGIVVGPISDSGFELRAPVAFPAAHAAQVATAAANSALAVMIGTARPMAGSSG